ncbi:MAG TPA: glycerophosphodiester phosphodiesterase family protein, partial [Bdellovibrionota bacterium]|nr:glycerophosphodiester phosphodiesterase family protein [Bdellovibrionota bacterium]
FVIFHDAELGRMTDLQGSLKQLGWERVKNARVRGQEPILTLVELLAMIPPGRLLNLELKSDTVSKPDLPEILEVLQGMRGPSTTMISSFDHELLPAFREAGYETGALIGDAHAKRGLAHLVLDLARIRPRFVNAPVQTFERLGAFKAALFFRALKAAGLKLAFWTINTDADFEKVRPYADAVIGDDVERALRWLGRDPLVELAPAR